MNPMLEHGTLFAYILGWGLVAFAGLGGAIAGYKVWGWIGTSSSKKSEINNYNQVKNVAQILVVTNSATPEPFVDVEPKQIDDN